MKGMKDTKQVFLEFKTLNPLSIFFVPFVSFVVNVFFLIFLLVPVPTVAKGVAHARSGDS